MGNPYPVEITDDAGEARLTGLANFTDAQNQPGGGSQPFSPADIPGLALWFDASQIIDLSDGDPVATWLDLSDNGFDATQSDGPSQPIYKTAIRNGLAVVRFAASPAQWLDVLDGLGVFRNKPGASFAVAGSVLFNGWDPFYISTESEATKARFGQNDGQVFPDPLDGGGNSPINGNGFATVDWSSFLAWVSCPDAVAGLLFAGGSFNFSGTFSEGADPYGLINGGSAFAASADTDSALVQINRHDGSNYGGARDVGEIVMYDRCLTPTERRKLNEYLADKWATVV